MLLSMDAHSIRRDTGITGDRDKRSEWVERDETMDHRSTSHNTIASASRRIVCLALISGPDLSNSFSPSSPPPPPFSEIISSECVRLSTLDASKGARYFPFSLSPSPASFSPPPRPQHFYSCCCFRNLILVLSLAPRLVSAFFFFFSLSLFYSHDTSNERADSDSGTEVSRRKFARKKRSEMEREKRLVNASSRRVRIDNKPR